MKRLTISVPDAIATKAARAVELGETDSVSAYFVQLAIEDRKLAGCPTCRRSSGTLPNVWTALAG